MLDASLSRFYFVVMFAASVAAAQPSPPTQPFSAEERALAERSVLQDARVRRIIGAERPRILVSAAEYDKTEANAFLAGTREQPPERRLLLHLINPQSTLAAEVLVTLAGGQARVLGVERRAGADIPFLREDAAAALDLARRDPEVRRAVGDRLDRFELVDPAADTTAPLVAEPLPIRASDPRDACAIGRCLEFVFRADGAYLPLRARVNLTQRSVSVQGEPGR